MNINTLSASGYETYNFCQWKYYLQYQLGYEDFSGPTAVLGTLSHHVLELLSKLSIINHYKDSKLWDVDYLWRMCFNRYYNLYSEVTEKIPSDKIIAVSRGIHKILETDYTPIRNNTISVEKKFDIPIIKNKGNCKELRIRGRIDRIDKIDNNTLEIIDYKSGGRINWDSPKREKKDEMYFRDNIQARLYHFASSILYSEFENFLLTFYYLIDGGPVTVPFCKEDIAETISIIKRRFQTIKANENPQKNITWKCKLCPFGPPRDSDSICSSVFKEREQLGAEFIENKYKLINYRDKRFRT